MRRLAQLVLGDGTEEVDQNPGYDRQHGDYGKPAQCAVTPHGICDFTLLLLWLRGLCSLESDFGRSRHVPPELRPTYFDAGFCRHGFSGECAWEIGREHV